MLFAVATGCLSRRSRDAGPAAPSPWRDWPEALAAAEEHAARNRMPQADSTLAAFVRRWPGTPQAEESTWWRLAYQAERTEDSASTAALMTRIDSLLAAAPASARRAELVMLRRAAALMQQVRVERTLARTEREAVETTAKQRADELEKLKIELEAVKAELERVRKRVTRTRP